MALSKQQRFLKLVYLFFLTVTDIIILVSMLTLNWLEGFKFRRGLWKICIEKKKESVEICFNAFSETWTLVCGSLYCSSFIFILLAIFVSMYHMVTFKNKIKRKASMISILVLIALAIFSLFSCLIAFPAIFTQSQIENYQNRFQILVWKFSWSYGLGWAAMIFLIGTLILILLDPATYFSDIRMNRKISLSSINTDDAPISDTNKQNKALLSC